MHTPSLHSSALDEAPTGPLRRAVAAFVALSHQILAAALDVPHGPMGEAGTPCGWELSRLARYSRLIARLTREIIRTEHVYAQMQARARLAADRPFRERVRLELGGYWIIHGWNARLIRQKARLRARGSFAKAKQVSGAGPGGAAAIAVRTLPPKPAARRGVKTDASGMFRLAPIPRVAAAARAAEVSSATRSNASPCRPRATLKPIALMPSEIMTRKPISPYSAPNDWEYCRRAGRYISPSEEADKARAAKRAPP